MKVVSLDEARRMARELTGVLEIDKVPFGNAAAPPLATAASPPPDSTADRLAAAIEAQTRAIERALTRVAAPAPAVAEVPQVPPVPQLVPLSQRAAVRAPKPRQRHAYQIIVQPDGQLRVERDGVARYQFIAQQDGQILVEREGAAYYQIDSQRDDTGLITRLSLTPIAPDGA